MDILYRKAVEADIPAIAAIYEAVHAEEEAGRAVIGWQRGVYPVCATAEASLSRGDLYVAETDGTVAASAILNKLQVDVYAGAPWEFSAPDDEVFVMHTLVVDPASGGHGLGRGFARFYEEEALRQDCRELRIDTQERNVRARALYRSLGYKEIASVPCTFNGIPGINLVLLEKHLG